MSDKEVEALKNVIRKEGKVERQRLFKYLVSIRKNGGSYDKKLCFSEVYRKLYKGDMDFLLRNELRLLSKQLMEFIAEADITQEQKQLTYLKRLSEKKGSGLFQKECKRLRKEFLEAGKYQALYQLSTLETKHFSSFELPPGVEGQLKLWKLNLANKQAFEAFAGIETTISDILGSFVQHNLSLLASSAKELPGPRTPILDKDPYYTYLCVKRDCYHADPYMRINSLTEAARLIMTFEHENVQRDKELSAILNNLAVEHFIQRHYQECREVFERLINDHGIREEAKVMSLFTYASTLLKTGAFLKGLEVLKSIDQEVSRIPYFQAKFCAAMAMSYVFLGESSQAKAMIPQDTKGGSRDDHLYLRLILSIVYYMEDKLDLCMRENENIIQAADGKAEYKVFAFCALSFNKWLGEPQGKKLERLRSDVAGMLSNKAIRHGDIMPLIWLNDKMQRK